MPFRCPSSDGFYCAFLHPPSLKAVPFPRGAAELRKVDATVSFPRGTAQNCVELIFPLRLQNCGELMSRWTNDRWKVAVPETATLPHPPLPLVGVSIRMERERQQNDSLVNG